MRLRICILLLALALTGVSRTTAATPAPDPTPDNVYGVIEIGAKGIKASVIQKLRYDPQAEAPPTKKLKEYKPEDKDAGNLEAIKSGRVVGAVSKIAHQMEEDYHMTHAHLYLVGSSGLPAENRTLLGALTFAEGQLDFVNPAQESTLLFKGIVPKHRINQVVVLDIGSGNSKGAYLEDLKGKKDSKSKRDFDTYSMQFGTTSWAEAVDKARAGEATFATTAEALRTSTLLPSVHSSMQLHPDMQKRHRIYLAGGTPWVMATLLHPEEIGADTHGERHDWVRLHASDIDAYLQKATENVAKLLKPSMDAVRPQNLREAEEEVARAVKTFTPEQILAGAQILKAFSIEMKFAEKEAKKDGAIFFSRRALYAWSHGYLLEKISGQ
jgi:hypothetical protein